VVLESEKDILPRSLKEWNLDSIDIFLTQDLIKHYTRAGNRAVVPATS